MAFCDTGYFNRATKIERQTIIALAMYYRLGKYDPSDKLTETYRNKEVIKLYKMATEERITRTNTLYEIYGHIHAMKQRINTTRDKLNKTH